MAIHAANTTGQWPLMIEGNKTNGALQAAMSIYGEDHYTNMCVRSVSVVEEESLLRGG